MQRHTRPGRLIATLALAAGIATGLAAAGRVGPFESLGVAVHPAAAHVAQLPLAAGQLYPTPTQPPSIHRIVVISDPPPPVKHSSAPAAPATFTPGPPVERTPQSTPVPSPSSSSPTPCPDDCQGGGGGGDN